MAKSAKRKQTPLYPPEMSLSAFLANLKNCQLLDMPSLNQLMKNHQVETLDVLMELILEKKLLTKFQIRAISYGTTKGLTLGKYQILDKIGEGGMGAVYKARHTVLDRMVALKVLTRESKKQKEMIRRFLREAKTAAQLSHPNIVAAQDSGFADGNHYLAMEFVEGKNLSQIVRRKGPMPASQAIKYTIQIAQGLEYAHQQGIIHRDIKPANILVDQNGNVKILDMGLARVENVTNDETDLTQVGSVMGTAEYMSPEQAIDSTKTDRRSDLYSLGCTLFYLISGKPPFTEGNQLVKMLAHREQPAPDLISAVHLVLPQVNAIYQRLMAKDPNERYQSSAELITALQVVLPQVKQVESKDVTAPPVPLTPQYSNSDTGLSVEDSQASGLTSFKLDSIQNSSFKLPLVRNLFQLPLPVKMVAGIVVALVALLGVYQIAGMFNGNDKPIIAEDIEQPIENEQTNTNSSLIENQQNNTPEPSQTLPSMDVVPPTNPVSTPSNSLGSIKLEEDFTEKIDYVVGDSIHQSLTKCELGENLSIVEGFPILVEKGPKFSEHSHVDQQGNIYYFTFAEDGFTKLEKLNNRQEEIWSIYIKSGLIKNLEVDEQGNVYVRGVAGKTLELISSMWKQEIPSSTQIPRKSFSFIFSVNNIGTFRWGHSMSLESKKVDQFATTNNGEIIATGIPFGFNDEDSNFVEITNQSVFAISAQGNIKWARELGGDLYARKIYVTKSGSISMLLQEQKSNAVVDTDYHPGIEEIQYTLSQGEKWIHSLLSLSSNGEYSWHRRLDTVNKFYYALEINDRNNLLYSRPYFYPGDKVGSYSHKSDNSSGSVISNGENNWSLTLNAKRIYRAFAVTNKYELTFIAVPFEGNLKIKNIESETIIQSRGFRNDIVLLVLNSEGQLISHSLIGNPNSQNYVCSFSLDSSGNLTILGTYFPVEEHSKKTRNKIEKYLFINKFNYSL